MKTTVFIAHSSIKAAKEKGEIVFSKTTAPDWVVDFSLTDSGGLWFRPESRASFLEAFRKEAGVTAWFDGDTLKCGGSPDEIRPESWVMDADADMIL